MFSIIGVLLVIAGLVKGSEASIDLKWGIVLIAFGGFMLLMAMRGSKSAPGEPPAAPGNPEPPKH
jgi:hypothetical protein